MNIAVLSGKQILMTTFRTLYIDMNSFFASVEQQTDPSLRGKPVGITAVDANSGSLVAASYEAKAFGIKTGTRVWEARRLCPGIILRPSRHRLYVRVNQKIAAVIDELAELEHVRSVDEFQVALGGASATLDNALALAQDIKAAIRARVGSELSCSIGIGPNHLLAKIASKLEKPNGLAWLAPDNMPARLAHLALDELPGISKGTKTRLLRAGICDIPALYGIDPRHARLIWHSIEGERFVRLLQGMDIPIPQTSRSGYGNSKVLAPIKRAPERAQLVGRWLVEKASARLRRDGWCAGRFHLYVSMIDGQSWKHSQSCSPTQETASFLSIYDRLWPVMIKARHPAQILALGVQLGDLIRLEDRNGELFTPCPPGERNKREGISHAVDSINRRYGKRLIQHGVSEDHPGFFERG